ncbi:MAG: O-antigen ligase family protein [Calothrix sp. MO_192.B10]|nr:O-antigen ligase family protein [Calothrix sp. MO_192.B10]
MEKISLKLAFLCQFNAALCLSEKIRHRNMYKFLKLAERIFIILGLTVFLGTLYRFSEVGLIPQNLITLIKYSTWASIVIINCIFWKDNLIALRQNILLTILTILVLLSFIWSDFPRFSLNIAIEILFMSLLGLYIAQRCNLKEQVEIIACCLLIQAFMSSFFAVFFPGIGIDNEFHPGAWQGVFGQKNSLGSVMVLNLLTFFTLPKENSNLYKYFGLIYSLLLIFLSTSKTSLIISILLILIVFFYQNFRWRGKISVIFANLGILIIGCIALVTLTYWIEILTGLGRDHTLTGRTPMWGMMIAKLMERPLLGYGLRAFWAPKSPHAIEVGQVIGTGWIPSGGHNGWLDLSLDVGLIGLSIFIINYLMTFAKALKLAYGTQKPEYFWPLAYLTYLAMNSVTESYLLTQGSLIWILYVTVVVMLNKKYPSNKNQIHDFYSGTLEGMKQ